MHALIWRSNEPCRSLVMHAIVMRHVMHAYALGASQHIRWGALVFTFELFCKFDQFNPFIALRRGGRT